jgi:hypothetical protein
LAEQLLTLTRNMENKHHDVLQEPMFHINVAELEEPIFLDRKYVFDNQVSIKASYGKDCKILVWLQRAIRQPPTTGAAPVSLLMVRDLFLLGDWREFQRFKQFVKSMRILDAQARNWLAEHHGDLPGMVDDRERMTLLLDCLAHISDWPDLEGGNAVSSLEMVAKTYSADLAEVRTSPWLPELLLARDPDHRFNIFRLFSFVEDHLRGTAGLVKFLTGMAEATGRSETIQACAGIRSSRDLQHGFAALRHALLRPG